MKVKKGSQVAHQFTKTKATESDKHKRKASTVSAVLRRPWTIPQFEELAKEERDIVLDRIEKEIVPLAANEPTVRPLVIRGVNDIARRITRQELQVVVFATNPNSQVFTHIPMLCRLHQVPICVLHLSSKAFGKIFQLKSLSVIGICKLSTEQDEADDVPENTRAKLQSIASFLISKASRKNNNLTL